LSTQIILDLKRRQKMGKIITHQYIYTLSHVIDRARFLYFKGILHQVQT
jgi:hypothetical protein